MSKQVRLTEPLVRVNGELRPASWDEALDRAAAGFARAREAGATKSFGMFSYPKVTNEMTSRCPARPACTAATASASARPGR